MIKNFIQKRTRQSEMIGQAVIDAVRINTNRKRWTTTGVLPKKGILGFGLFSAVATLSSQVMAQLNFDETLETVQENVFTVFDWVVLVIGALIFVIGIIGLAVGLYKVFTSRGAEGWATLLGGVVAVIVTVALVAVLTTGYESAKG